MITFVRSPLIKIAGSASVSRPTTKKNKRPTNHGLTTQPLMGHLSTLLKNCQCFLDWSTDLIVVSLDLGTDRAQASKNPSGDENPNKNPSAGERRGQGR
jgi:hypothetical protein